MTTASSTRRCVTGDDGAGSAPVRIAIASGKGGTGKTTVAANLAALAARAGLSAAYVDCDVEEPNGHLFLKPRLLAAQSVHKLVPEVVDDRCASCGECARFCRFNAIACLPRRTVVYPELCHACGGCLLVCPEDAFKERRLEIGSLQHGWAGSLRFVQGCLRVGESQSPPLIRAVKDSIPAVGLAFLDAPPGTSCPAVETARGADFVVLVAEPTLFGLHDLQLAVEMVRSMKLPCGVILNRALSHREAVREFCRGARLPLLGEIPDDLRIAQACSKGELIIDTLPGYLPSFAGLLQQVLSAAAPDLAHPNFAGNVAAMTAQLPLEANGRRVPSAEVGCFP